MFYSTVPEFIDPRFPAVIACFPAEFCWLLYCTAVADISDVNGVYVVGAPCMLLPALMILLGSLLFFNFWGPYCVGVVLLRSFLLLLAFLLLWRSCYCGHTCCC
jgi:hypothetical protein